MTLHYAKHEKISLRKHPVLNERWLQDRIEEDPSILRLGSDLRLVDRERPLLGGGRLDVVLMDDDNDRRFEVEIQLGQTDPSHIVRCIEYWDLERRRYPGYEHIAVLVAEDVTTRFLNVISLMAGSIPIVAIQLDALQLGDQVLLNFTHILDQSELRTDDDDGDGGGGGQTDRTYWDQRAGQSLMTVCDELLKLINANASTPLEFNYLRGYFGLRRDGVVNNFIHFSPKRTKNFAHVFLRNTNAAEWHEKFQQAGIPSRNQRKSRLQISVNPADMQEHEQLIKESIAETVQEFEG